LHVVVHDHLLRSANNRAPNLGGSQPIDVHMADDAGAVLHGQVGDVFAAAAGMGGTDGAHLGWQDPAQDVVNDAHVVRRQVPDHIDIGLEDAEVDPHTVDIEDFTQRAASHQFAHHADRAREHEGVIHGKQDATLFG
jgi:hypothetical protein